MVSEGQLSNCSACASHCNDVSRCSAWALEKVVLASQLQHLGSVVAAHGFWSTGSVVVAHGCSFSGAGRIFLDQGSYPCLLHWQVNS